jgi:hypothetical protein
MLALVPVISHTTETQRSRSNTWSADDSDAARRHRVLTCSHAVLELSNAILSVIDRGSTLDQLDLSKAIAHKLPASI